MSFKQKGEREENQSGSIVVYAPGSEIDILGNMQLKGANVNLDDLCTTNIGFKKARIPLNGGVDTAGGLGSWQNNTGQIVMIREVWLHMTHIATAANTIDVGTTTANATTDSANLISAQDTHTAVVTKVSAVANAQPLAPGGWVTVSTTPNTGGASAGLTGEVWVIYTPLTMPS